MALVLAQLWHKNPPRRIVGAQKLCSVSSVKEHWQSSQYRIQRWIFYQDQTALEAGCIISASMDNCRSS
jgi:hypothetical protein